MSYRPPPKIPAAFPGLRRVKPKTSFGGGLRVRWKDDDGYLYEWDYQHGAVEKYSSNGTPLGEYDPDSGNQTKDADVTRRIEP